MNVPYLMSPVRHTESNGSITVFEQGALPYSVRRAFLVSAQEGQVRGAHAHRQCWQALFVVSGRVVVDTTSGEGDRSFTLESLSEGLVIPPLVWATQSYFGVDPQLLVVCSHTFDEADYIRSMQDFKALLLH